MKIHIMKKSALPVGILCLVILLSGCAPKPVRLSYSSVFFALDTVISVNAYGDESLEVVSDTENYINSLENDFSRTLPESLVYKINHSEERVNKVDERLMEILRLSKKMYDITDGKFDITIAPAADLWGFTKDSFRVPTDEEIENVKSKVGFDHVHIDDETVVTDEGTGIDLGGIAKGYALENIKDIFEGHSLDGGLANMGGDILVYGNGSSGDLWHIGIKDPAVSKKEDDSLGILEIKDRYILTSGGYERYFEENGRHYSHILNPINCMPAYSDILSVTVVTDLEKGYGTAADALATALFIMGSKEAEEFWKDNQWFDMIVVDDLGNIYVSEGIKDNFVLIKPKKYNCIIID